MAMEKQRNTHPRTSATKFASFGANVARQARDRALAAGLTVTTHKEGRLVQEMLVGGELVELFSQIRERPDDLEI